MTSSDHVILTVEHEGVVCKSDAGVYNAGYEKELHFLSIYGAPQQTKGIFSALASGKELTIGDDEFHRPRDSLRFRGYSLGYGKHHGIIWTDNLDISLIIWTSEQEKRARLRNLLAGHRVPYDPEDLERIERLLLRHGHLISLESWGRIDGYQCDFNDDAICDLLLAEIYHSAARKAA
ncbi:MAG: hypothetical protein A4E57_00819 [Syntrophorhabdaceae bacterium PtaU1.Bin034]|jgi:hypothetical protein|nr:MAG: hypothetical protein A4E57_00819 [Syntrophorhabdaceae bacterium PtaU1.Bin034]